MFSFAAYYVVVALRQLFMPSRAFAAVLCALIFAAFDIAAFSCLRAADELMLTCRYFAATWAATRYAIIDFAARLSVCCLLPCCFAYFRFRAFRAPQKSHMIEGNTYHIIDITLSVDILIHYTTADERINNITENITHCICHFSLYYAAIFFDAAPIRRYARYAATLRFLRCLLFSQMPFERHAAMLFSAVFR